MKMKFCLWEKVTGHFKVIESKSEYDAFKSACKKFGENGFYGLKRYYPNKHSIEHKMFFIKRAISNVDKHLNKQQRHGL